MYAVVETGGKQYRVAPGQKVRVDRLEGELGSEVTLDRVLVVVDDNHNLTAGNPTVGLKPYIEETATFPQKNRSPNHSLKANG